ncbi:MAG: NUDIX domain-containing protein [bacterium]|nr:NUDIX domain-containing protein [bacterium]
MLKERFKIVPSSYLILVKNNKVLLWRRYNSGYEDEKYSLVAGHLEGNESFAEAMIRETKEEINIKLKAKDLKVVHVMNRFAMQKNVELRERVDIFFVAKKWQGEIKNMEPHKCDDLSWFYLNNLPNNTIPYIKHALDCVKNKIYYSEYGFKHIK